MEDCFLILGATGLVGAEVLRLLKTEARTAFGTSRRRSGEGWRYLDLLDRSTYRPALEGITTVMLLSRPGDEEADRHAKPFIAAMTEAGVERIVTLSALGADRRPEFSIRKVEVLVEESGLGWTHVRPNFFMQTLTRPPLSQEIANYRTLSLPLADAKIAYVDALDVAATVARALTDTSLLGKAIELNGPEALNHHEITRLISLAIGDKVEYCALSEEAARTALLKNGFALPQVERILRFYELCREGLGSNRDAEVSRLLGRPLHCWNEVIEANCQVWLQRPC